uniref:Yippee domain-containing protein n=1 Tax=Elaeophora elaphi TaxID=1147741 RepID=A0A0R3RN58_9BILA
MEANSRNSKFSRNYHPRKLPSDVVATETFIVFCILYFESVTVIIERILSCCRGFYRLIRRLLMAAIPAVKLVEPIKKEKSKTFQAYLPDGARTYSCVHCRANLANHNELISKSFQGSQGKAYLFNSV